MRLPVRARVVACLAFVACGGTSPAPSANPGDSGAPSDPARDGASHEAREVGPPSDRASRPRVDFIDTADGKTVTRALLGDPLDIVISGLPPNAEVTVDACSDGYGNWSSSAVFRASATGTVDVASVVPLRGDYVGADAEGLFWSMTEKKSRCVPPLPRNDVGITASVGGKAVAHAPIDLFLPGDGVSCSKVTDSPFVGYYCAKKGQAPVGGIVAFGGSEGGLSTGQGLALYYASLGYPTLGLAYFGAKGLPKTLANIPLEYFQPAFAWLAKQKEVSPGKLLVNGLSRGGELALLLGATFPEVTAVVAELPSGVLWPSLDGTQPGWTYAGTPLPYISAAGSGVPQAVKEPGGVTAYADLPLFTSSLAASTPAEIGAATTPVENTHGPILMIAGFDDQLWGACDLAQYAVDRLVSSGHAGTYGDSLLCYPSAGHNVDSFELDVPTTLSLYAGEGGQVIALGGTPAGIAHASRDADTKKRAFFAANLR